MEATEVCHVCGYARHLVLEAEKEPQVKILECVNCQNRMYDARRSLQLN